MNKECIIIMSQQLRDAKGEGEKLKLLARKLDTLGYIKTFSIIANDPGHLHKLLNQLQLLQSLATIEQAEIDKDSKNKDQDLKVCRELGPAVA